MTDQSFDRFTMPRDIPDSAVSSAPPAEAPFAWGAYAVGRVRRQGEDSADARGYTASHPAGRGWVPGSRDLGLPGEDRPVWPDGGAWGFAGDRTDSLDVAQALPLTPPAGGRGDEGHRTVTIEHTFPERQPDDPVAAIGGGAVFTRERRVRFLDHLAFKGNVRAAAALVGVSHETVYRARRQDAAFAALWEAALVHARHYAESRLATHALDGQEVPILYRGELVAYRRVYDPRLMLAHLARLDARVAYDEDTTARAGRFDALLGHYAGAALPEGFMEVGAEADEEPPTREDHVAWARNAVLDDLAEPDEAEDEEPTEADAEAEAMDAAGELAGAEWDAWHAKALARVEQVLGQARGERGEDDDERGQADDERVLRQAQDEREEEAPSPNPLPQGERAPVVSSPLAGEGGAPQGAEGEGDFRQAQDEREQADEEQGERAPVFSSPLAGEGGAPHGAEGEGDFDQDPDAVPENLPYEIKAFPGSGLAAKRISTPRNRVTCVNLDPSLAAPGGSPGGPSAPFRLVPGTARPIASFGG